MGVIMKSPSLLSLLVSVAVFALTTGCTDPTQTPMLIQLVPNPVVPLSTPQNLDFLGNNLDTDVYFMLDTGNAEILLEPQNAPGHWTFRCVFGFHFIYTFDSLEAFVLSLGSPSQITIRAFNVGPNLVREFGGGDDLPSQPVTWIIRD